MLLTELVIQTTYLQHGDLGMMLSGSQWLSMLLDQGRLLATHSRYVFSYFSYSLEIVL
jgi:hypothetical protein